ncbi:NUMOD4 domain-containing protein [Hoylesella timonensis]|uniref:NUMOD4 domain-containing protein n=1 Tax=Hoylesella timonensis TaxID=386414 RepID=UPI001897E143|nr:NUMOD4 domain-containing protein [Hoylesella timonensis]
MPKNNEIREGKKQSIALTTSDGTKTVSTKVCKVCKQEKPISEFYKSTVCVCKRCVCHRNSQKILDRNLKRHPDLPNEEWKEAVGFCGNYLVSNFGRVRSMVYGGHRGQILSITKHRQGYAQVKLSKDGEPKSYLIHRLVGKAFIPNPQHKKTINHIDGNKANNHVNNLEWATQSENNKHAFRTGLHIITDKQRESMTKGFKISNSQVLEIRELFRKGMSLQQIANVYNVSKAQVCRIVNHKSRK